jgi:hypothetical protein
LIRDAVGREGIAGAIWIGDRVWIEFVGREVAEIFSMDRERDKKEETREQEFHATPPGWDFSQSPDWQGVKEGLPESAILYPDRFVNGQEAYLRTITSLLGLVRIRIVR